MKWNVYIVQCEDGSLYTGITTNIDRRIHEHNVGKGAKYLRGKLPVKVIYFEQFNNQSEAMRRESEIKDWKRERKLQLIKKKFKGH